MGWGFVFLPSDTLTPPGQTIIVPNYLRTTNTNVFTKIQLVLFTLVARATQPTLIGTNTRR